MILNTTQAKYVAMASLGLGSFLVGMIPACFANRKNERKLLLSSLLCFGAGVLMSTSLLHILPETRKSLPDYADLVFCFGFLLIYFVNEIVNFFEAGSVNHSEESRQHQCGGIISQREYSHDLGHSHDPDRSGLGQRRGHCEFPNALNCHDGQEYYPSLGTLATAPHLDLITNSHSKIARNNIECRQHHHHHHHRYGSVVNDQSIPSSVASHPYNEMASLLRSRSHSECSISVSTGIPKLLFALTMHAILEGLAVGLQKKSEEVFLLVAAIASHKIVVGFCLGVEFATASSILKHTIGIAAFAAGSAGGIGIGMMVSEIEKSWASKILVASLQGLTGGSLLYVSCSEILPRERANWYKSRRREATLIQFFSVTCGVSLMYILDKCVSGMS